MRELTDPFEIEQYKEELNEHRGNEQKANNDYDYGVDGEIEVCECGNPLNSHGWCYRCDG